MEIFSYAKISVVSVTPRGVKLLGNIGVHGLNHFYEEVQGFEDMFRRICLTPRSPSFVYHDLWYLLKR